MFDDQRLQHREIPIPTQRARDLLQRTNVASDRPGIHAPDRGEPELEPDHPLPVLVQPRKVVVFIDLVVESMPDVPPGPVESIDHGVSVDRLEVDRSEPTREVLETTPYFVDDRLVFTVVARDRQGLRGGEHRPGRANGFATATTRDLLAEAIEQVQHHVPIPKR